VHSATPYPRMVMPISSEPRPSNLSTAKACSSYSTSPMYDDEQVHHTAYRTL
jgi:hypothetical protein